jgi:hypothetical protein
VDAPVLGPLGAPVAVLVAPVPFEAAAVEPAAVEPAPLVPALPPRVPAEPPAEACVRMNEPDESVELPPPAALLDPLALAACKQPVSVT